MVGGKCECFQFLNLMTTIKDAHAPLRAIRGLDLGQAPKEGWLGNGPHQAVVKKVLAADLQLRNAYSVDKPKLVGDNLDGLGVKAACTLADLTKEVVAVGLKAKEELNDKVEKMVSKVREVQHGMSGGVHHLEGLAKADTKSWKPFQVAVNKKFEQGNVVAGLKQTVNSIDQAFCKITNS